MEKKILLTKIPVSYTHLEFSGIPLVQMGDESPVYRAVAEMMGKIL